MSKNSFSSLSSSSIDTMKRVSKLYTSLVSLCRNVAQSGQSNSKTSVQQYFQTTNDQVEYLLLNHMANNNGGSLDQWYHDEFVPVLDAYLQNSSASNKCQSKSEHYKRFADLYYAHNYHHNSNKNSKIYQSINKVNKLYSIKTITFIMTSNLILSLLLLL